MKSLSRCVWSFGHFQSHWRCLNYDVWGVGEDGRGWTTIRTYFYLFSDLYKIPMAFFFSVAVEKSILYLPLKLTLIWGMHSFIMELFHFLGKQKKGHFGLV